jgi:beta-aspartyl-dipeptidase (metallo-type)
MGSNTHLQERAKFILITNADIYTPEHFGIGDIFFCGSQIIKVGRIDQKKLLQSNLDIEVIDVKRNILVPGIIDPHSHLLGGSGENGGFSSQTPEITMSEIVKSGVTSVVGTLGADTTMKTMQGLLAKVKGLNDEGLSACCYSGGYTVPPTTIMKSISDDIMFISEVIGVGEISINDERSQEPFSEKLARTVVDTHLAGNLADKAGVSHFHVGGGKINLKSLFDLLDSNPNIDPKWLYPTHVERNVKLLQQAIRLTKRGSYVDMDTVEGDLAKWLHVYTKNGGNLKQLTISSDSCVTGPGNILKELKDCIQHHRYKLETLLPLVTENTAKILKFKDKGKLGNGYDSSFIVLENKTLELIHVCSKGKFMMKDGIMCVKEKFLENSNREIHLVGDKTKK